MKFHESSFIDIISAARRYDMHASSHIIPTRASGDTPFQNTIIYGARGIGKYTQALLEIEPHSPSGLKYERRVTVPNEKMRCVYKTSDVHCEVDMMLLGCNAKTLWADVFGHMTVVAALKKSPIYIILCKNFHAAHTEIIDIFYSYMQPSHIPGVQLRFILLTEHIGFIADDILSRCKVIPLARPTADVYASMICENMKHANHISAITERELHATISDAVATTSAINTCKDLYWYADAISSRANARPRDISAIVLASVISVIDKAKILSIPEIRETLYEILVYGQDIHEITWRVFEHYISTGELNLFAQPEFMPLLFAQLKYRNNNYREIFHLENIMFLFANSINIGL